MDKKNTPEVKLGQYKGLAVTRHVRPVTDKTEKAKIDLIVAVSVADWTVANVTPEI